MKNNQLSVGYSGTREETPVFTVSAFIPTYRNRGSGVFRIFFLTCVSKDKPSAGAISAPYGAAGPACRGRLCQTWTGSAAGYGVRGRSPVLLRRTGAVRQLGVGTFKSGQQGKPRPLIQQQWQRLGIRGTRHTESGYPRCAPSHGHQIWECV